MPWSLQHFARMVLWQKDMPEWFHTLVEVMMGRCMDDVHIQGYLDSSQGFQVISFFVL